MKVLTRWFIPIAVALTVAGCPFKCACDEALSGAVVYGRVTSPTSEAVSGATVIVYNTAADGCHANSYEWVEFAGVSTELDGSYRKSIPGYVISDSVCVFVFAQPPDGSADLATSDTSLVSLAFRDTLPEDSARVDLIMRAR